MKYKRYFGDDAILWEFFESSQINCLCEVTFVHMHHVIDFSDHDANYVPTQPSKKMIYSVYTFQILTRIILRSKLVNFQKTCNIIALPLKYA